MNETKHLKELLVLKEISETLNAGTDLRITLKNVLSKLLNVTGFQTGWIFSLMLKEIKHLKHRTHFRQLLHLMIILLCAREPVGV